MSGISGYFLTHREEESTDKVLWMSRTVAHRGPDDEGVVLINPASSSAVDLRTSDTAGGVGHGMSVEDAGRIPHRIAFGHRRLGVIDRSSAAHQPFWSRDRKVCVCSNGEIYNYVELREELRALGHEFRTDSDTEVLVEAYLRWGVGCFSRFNGFWALSLYDAREKAVLLARDRIGKVPLYIARTPGGLWWSSELKGIFSALGQSAFKVREQAVVDYVENGWRDVFNKTFYEGIVTFPSASYAWVGNDGSYEPHKYWSLPGQRMREREISPEEAAGRIYSLLADAIRVRLRADVPLVFGLSGGMDSSSVVAVAAQMEYAIKTFIISFHDASSDEEWYAGKVAGRYPGMVDLTVLKPPVDNFFDKADGFFRLEEEPFHSPSLLLDQEVYRTLSGQGIRVVMDGAGGDALFAGETHLHAPYLRHLLERGRFLRLTREFFMFTEGPCRVHLSRALQFVLGSSPEVRSSSDPFKRPPNTETLSGLSRDLQRRLIDYMGDWGMNYWFRSGEKSSMGVPMVDRSPFFDYRLVDFAFSLPLGYLIRDGWLKWILRYAMKDVLPPEVAWRKRKFGGLPLRLQDWLAASEQRFFSMTGDLDCPYLDLGKLRAAYPGLLKRNPHYLWRLICLALWWKKCVRGDPLV
jgi:asparagine synthase (glutamine-hydrolysing)